MSRDIPGLSFEFGGDGGGGQYDGWFAAYLPSESQPGYLERAGYLDWAISDLHPDHLWVKMVEVDPAHRGKGIARALLDKAIYEQFTRWGSPPPAIYNDYLTQDGRRWWDSLQGYNKVDDPQRTSKVASAKVLYRGMTVIVPEGEPLNATSLVAASQRDTRWGLGTHWTTDRSVVESFARPREPRLVPALLDGPRGTTMEDPGYTGPRGTGVSVLFQAESQGTADPSYFVDPTDRLPHEQEVTLSPGSPLRLTGVEWWADGRWNTERTDLSVTAMPQSWRPFSDVHGHALGDAVIAVEVSGRKRVYDIYTYGTLVARRHRLDDAKREVEQVYGPLNWERVKNPPVEVFHYYFGPTVEFTEPSGFYVVEKLPKLGKLALKMEHVETLENYATSVREFFSNDLTSDTLEAIEVINMAIEAAAAKDADGAIQQANRVRFMLQGKPYSTEADLAARRFLARIAQTIVKLVADYPTARVPETLLRELTRAWDATRSSSERRFAKVASGGTYYHLADEVNFQLDPTFHPRNNTTIGGDWSEPGIFVTDSPEHWLNGYGYWRPWIVEFQVAPGVGKDFGDETFIPATAFDQVRMTRVLPLDGYCREEYNDWGWTEDHFGTQFDTGEPVPSGTIMGYRPPEARLPAGYRSPDARQMDASWRAGYAQRVDEFARTRPGVYVRSSKTANDYRGQHAAPSDGAPLHDLLAVGFFPDDVYETLRHYTHMSGQTRVDRESIRAVEQMRGKPNAMVTIYRSLPPNVDPHFNTGDWVALSETYAREHGGGMGWDEWVEPATPGVFEDGEGWVRREGDWPVISAEVPVHTVLNGGNDIVEWGYHGPTITNPRVGSKTASGFEPMQVATWEQTQPWNVDREDLELQRIPGIGVGQARGTEDASFSGGRIILKEQWFDRAEETRRAILYHEAGHGLEEQLGLMEVGRYFGVHPLDVIDLPGATRLGYNPSEVVAEAYSQLWSDPAWFETFEGGPFIRDTVIQMASDQGYPLPSGLPRGAKLASSEPIEDWTRIPPFHRGPLTLRGWHVSNAAGSGLTPEAREVLGRDTMLGPGFYFGPADAVGVYGDAVPVEVTLNNPKVMWSPGEGGWDIQTLDELEDTFGTLYDQGHDGIVIPVASVFGADEAQAVLRPGQGEVRFLDEHTAKLAWNRDHAHDRVNERLTEAGYQDNHIRAVWHIINAIAAKAISDTAVRILTLPYTVGEAWGDRSNGNQLWAIYRGREVRTVMFRRDTQPSDPGAFRVDNVMFLQPEVFSNLLPRDLIKVAMPDADGWWYHTGMGVDRYTMGQYVHLGTHAAATDRFGDVGMSGHGSLFRVRINPQNPLGSLSNPLTDAEANTLEMWEDPETGYVVEAGQMPEPDEGVGLGILGDPYEVARRVGYQGAFMHDAVYYRNEVEDPGSISVMVDPDAVVVSESVDDDPTMHLLSSFNQHTLWPETVYRGLEFGWVDWEVLDEVIPLDAASIGHWVSTAARGGALGQHWAKDFEVAKQFSIGKGLSGGFRHEPNDESSYVGIVIEGQADGADVVEEGDPEWEYRRLNKGLIRGEDEANISSGTPIEVTRAWVYLREQDDTVELYREVPLNLQSVASQSYYHGTLAELDVGDLILPASQLGRGTVHRISDGDFAYASRTPSNAEFYAELAWNAAADGDMAVYEVRPLGEVEPDPNIEGPTERGGVRAFDGDVRTDAGFEVIRRVSNQHTAAATVRLTHNQLDVLLDWLDTAHDADPDLQEELWSAYMKGGVRTVSIAAVDEAVYYSENVMANGTWGPNDQKVLDAVTDKLVAHGSQHTAMTYERFPGYNHHLPGDLQVEVDDETQFQMGRDYRSLRFLAIAPDGEWVGWLDMTVADGGFISGDYPDDAAVISDVFVDPPWRRQGVAEGLLAAARDYLHPIKVVHNDQLSEDGVGWSSRVGRTAFLQNLDWRVTQSREDYQVVEAVHGGIRFVLEGSDSYKGEPGNWGRPKLGGWRLQILEPGDRVNLGVPHRHRFEDETVDWRDREVKSTFDTLAEGKSYIEDFIIGKGMVEQMVPRDLFPPGTRRYHLTLARNVPSILSQGLLPGSQEGTGSSVFEDLSDSFTILWDLKNEDWARHQGQDFALLQLDVGGLRRSTVRALTNEERVNDIVPSNRIQVVVGNIPWFLTESRFGGWSLSDSEVLAAMRRDPRALRKAWTGNDEEFDRLMATGARTSARDNGHLAPYNPKTAASTYYHASNHEFGVGDLVLPQAETGVPNWAEQLGVSSDQLGPHYSSEHVYLADHIDSALPFGDSVYEVEPLGGVHEDPESMGAGWHYTPGAARVVKKVVYKNRPLAAKTATNSAWLALARGFPTFEEFSRAVSLEVVRPYAWHLTDEADFTPDPNHQPTDRSGATTRTPALFLTVAPEMWTEGYLSERTHAVGYDLTGLTYGTDYYSDRSGNEGLVVHPHAYNKLREVGRYSVAQAQSEANRQQQATPRSRAEAQAIFEAAHGVTAKTAAVPEQVIKGRNSEVVEVPVAWLKTKTQQSFQETLHGRSYEDRVFLRNQIEHEGILVPLELGSARPGVYQLMDGHQRLLIAEALGMDMVPVKLVTGFSTAKTARYTPDHQAPVKGDWDRTEDTPRWMQEHRTLVEDALWSWVGYPSSMRIHIDAEQNNEPQPPSGSGKKMRAQAAALAYEVEHNSRPNDEVLYRSAGTLPTGITSWSKRKAVAKRWRGDLYRLPVGAARGIKVSDYITSQIDHDEQQWLIHATGASLERTGSKVGRKFYHVTDNPQFVYNPNHLPEDVYANDGAGGMTDTPGLFVTDDIDWWKARGDYVVVLDVPDDIDELDIIWDDYQREWLLAPEHMERSRVVDILPRDQVVMATKTASTTYYHASPARLSVGDELRPAETSRFQRQTDDRVYFTPDPWVAVFHIGGVTKLHDDRAFLYEVSPIGQVEEDPEAIEQGKGGQSYMAPGARVLRRLSLDEAREVMMRTSKVAANLDHFRFEVERLTSSSRDLGIRVWVHDPPGHDPDFPHYEHIIGHIEATYNEGYHDDKAIIVNVIVEPAYQHQGIATELLKRLRQEFAPIEVVHNTDLSDAGRGWSQSVGTKTASAITYEVTETWIPEWMEVVARDGDTVVGRLSFNARWGQLDKVMVDPAYRRRGIATQMANLAKQHGSFEQWNLGSQEFSEDGAAWATTLEGREVYPTWASPADFSGWMRGSSKTAQGDPDFERFVEDVKRDFKENRDHYADLVQRLLPPDHDLVSIELIGSYVRGDARPDSDVDLLVRYRGPLDEDEVFWKLEGQVHGFAGTFDIIVEDQSFIERGGRYMGTKTASGSGDSWFHAANGETYWGPYGAAGLLVRHQPTDEDDNPTDDPTFFLQRRAGWTDDGGTWSVPGGALEHHESPEQGAKREFAEETGIQVTHFGWVDNIYYRPASDWSYTTVVVETDEKFSPEIISHEASSHGWFTFEELSQMDLHPGLRSILPELRGFALTAQLAA